MEELHSWIENQSLQQFHVFLKHSLTNPWMKIPNKLLLAPLKSCYSYFFCLIILDISLPPQIKHSEEGDSTYGDFSKLLSDLEIKCLALPGILGQQLHN